MLRTILKKEITDHFLSLRFTILCFLCLSIIPLALFVSYKDYQNKLADYNRSVQLSREELNGTPDSQVFSTTFEIKGYRPPSSLAVFASGLDDVMPQAIAATKAGLSLGRANIADESILTLFGKIDFMFVVELIFSLLAIIFAFDAVCGEKEAGTLKLILANRVPRDSYILAKYAGGILTIGLAFLISLILGLILLGSSGFPLFSGELTIRIGAMFFACLVYISVFYCMGLTISSQTHSSRTSLMISIFVWIFLVIVIPKASHILSKAFMPVRSEQVVALEKALLRQDLEVQKGQQLEQAEKKLPSMDIVIANQDRLMEALEERNKVLNPIRDEYAAKINRGIDKIDEQYQAEKSRQFTFALNISRISPVTSFNKIVTDLAWTGEHAKKHFLITGQNYQNILNHELFQYVFRDLTPGGGVSMGLSREVDLKTLPAFQYTRISLRETMRSIGVDIIMLLCFGILFFGTAYFSFIKYDMR